MRKCFYLRTAVPCHNVFTTLYALVQSTKCQCISNNDFAAKCNAFWSSCEFLSKMSLLERIQAAKNKLKEVETIVVLEDGTETVEQRSSDGTFQRIAVSSNELSNRQRKKGEYKKRMGFVIDLKPDMELAHVSNTNLYIGSQDVAADLCLLKNAKITHVINCATGVPNHFPTHFKYLNLELYDLPQAPLLAHADKIKEFCDVDSSSRIFVHCNAGISRASSVVILRLMQLGLSFDDAYRQVKDARKFVRIMDS